MLSLLATLALGAGASTYPLDTAAGAIYLAKQDLLLNVSPLDRTYTRYLSLYNLSPADCQRLTAASDFGVNSLQLTPAIKPVARCGNGLLLRLNTVRLRWDAASRAERIATLKKRGVTFKKGDVSADPWETLARKDPYFEASKIFYRVKDVEVTTVRTYLDAYGRPFQQKEVSHQKEKIPILVRGWVDPAEFATIQKLTHSAKPILRADWFLYNAWTDRPLGSYSDFLMLPSNLVDLFKVLAVEDKRQVADGVTVGGATGDTDSYVALGPRELRLLGSGLFPGAHLWETFDFDIRNVAKDIGGLKDPFQQFAGTVKRDGGEVIFAIPNGLHGYYLVNGAGKQVDAVPDTIARDQRKDQVETRVLNAWKCVSCHGPASGVIPFRDRIAPLVVEGGKIGLGVEAYDRRSFETERERITNYYQLNYTRTIELQQSAYADAVKRANGLDSPASAKAFVGAIERYAYDLVDLPTAARELGLPESLAPNTLGPLRRLNNATLQLIASGQPRQRARFEQSFRDGMEGVPVYPWEVADIAKQKGYR